MKRIKNIILLITLIFLFWSCASTNGIYTSGLASKEQVVFLRPFTVKSNIENIYSVELDVTVLIKNQKINNNPVLNYTIFANKSIESKLQKMNVQLLFNSEEIPILSKEIIFKEMIDSKKCQIRFTSSIDKDIFEKSLEKDGVWSIRLWVDENNEEEMSSKHLDDKIERLKFIL